MIVHIIPDKGKTTIKLFNPQTQEQIGEDRVVDEGMTGYLELTSTAIYYKTMNGGRARKKKIAEPPIK